MLSVSKNYLLLFIEFKRLEAGVSGLISGVFRFQVENVAVIYGIFHNICL